MVVHLGTFGSRSLFWDQPAVQPWPEDQAPMAETLTWLREAQARLRRHVAELDDAELDRPRVTNWGEERPSRWILAMLITHDAYHAGEINHLRSLLSGDDRWNFVRDLEGG
jgi:uncharacterized damage-inducible protein DinB